MQMMDKEDLCKQKYRMVEDIKKTDLEVMKIKSSFDPGFSRKLYEQKLLKGQLKQKHIASTVNKLFFEYMAQDPELWPTGTDSDQFTEKIHNEYKKVIDERTEKENEISSMCETAEEAYSLLQIKLQEFEQVKENLDKKISKLRDIKSRKTTNQEEGPLPENVAEKIIFIDAEIAKILDTKQIALKRFQDTLKLVEELRKRVHETEKQVELKHRLEEAELSDMSGNVESIRKRVDDMEALGGVRAHMVSRTSVCLEFLQIHVFDDVNLQLLLEFNNTDGKTVLMSAKVNESVLFVEDLLSAGVKTNDVVTLVQQLKTRWMSHIPLITEINQLRQMYAIDWIPEDHLLRIIVGKKSTIVCTLQIPETYPSAGKITPVNISGEVNSEDTTILEPEGTGTLMDWARYLEEKYKNQ